MAKIKHTKNELKAQREALRRFERFLPMLQLKKQQLQAESQRITAEILEKEQKEKSIRSRLNTWIKILPDSPVAFRTTEKTAHSAPSFIENLISLESVTLETGNIAGVNIPLLQKVNILKSTPDLFSTPAWTDDAITIIGELINLRVERQVLDEQHSLIMHELTITSQRVNLFEKVKIPECKENIRVIKIFLGDEQTAAVVRGKIAKKRTEEYEYNDEAA